MQSDVILIELKKKKKSEILSMTSLEENYKHVFKDIL